MWRLSPICTRPLKQKLKKPMIGSIVKKFITVCVTGLYGSMPFFYELSTESKVDSIPVSLIIRFFCCIHNTIIMSFLFRKQYFLVFLLETVYCSSLCSPCWKKCFFCFIDFHKIYSIMNQHNQLLQLTSMLTVHYFSL